MEWSAWWGVTNSKTCKQRLLPRVQRGKATCLFVWFCIAYGIAEEHIGIFLRGIFGNCIGIIHFDWLVWNITWHQCNQLVQNLSFLVHSLEKHFKFNFHFHLLLSPINQSMIHSPSQSQHKLSSIALKQIQVRSLQFFFVSSSCFVELQTSIYF